MLELVRTRIEPHGAPHPAPQAEPPAWDLDEPHAAIWHAVRPLFPRHASATQTDHGCLVISWLVSNPRRGTMHYAAPVIIRIEPGLLLALWTCGADDRRAIAQLQKEAVAQALQGYDPHSRVPTCDVIVLGDG